MLKIHDCLWFELPGILFCGLPLLFPDRFISLSWHPYLFLALFLGWLLRLSIHKSLSNWSSLHGGIYFILLWLPINIWASANPDTSWIAAGYLLFGVALYFALVNWPLEYYHATSIVIFLLLAVGCLSLVSPPLVAWKPEFRLFHLPLYDLLQSVPIDVGETIHANVFAGVLVIGLPFFTSIVFIPSKKMHFLGRYALIVGTISSIIMLVLTQSRSGYLGAAVGLLFLPILYTPRFIRLAPLWVALIGSAAWYLSTETIMDALTNDGSLGGWNGRIDIWTQSWQALGDFIFTGSGIGTFAIVIPLLYPLKVNIESFPHAHNLFLQIGLDLGLPGLIAYLAILINLYTMLWQLLRSPQSDFSRAITVGATGSLTAMLVHGILDTGLWGTKLAFFPWILFALITLLHREHHEQRERPPN